MEVDELAVEESEDASGAQSKSPLEKMRVRLAAENYNSKNRNNYRTLNDDAGDDSRSTPGLYTLPLCSDESKDLGTKPRPRT